MEGMKRPKAVSAEENDKFAAYKNLRQQKKERQREKECVLFSEFHKINRRDLTQICVECGGHKPKKEYIHVHVYPKSPVCDPYDGPEVTRSVESPPTGTDNNPSRGPGSRNRGDEKGRRRRKRQAMAKAREEIRDNKRREKVTRRMDKRGNSSKRKRKREKRMTAAKLKSGEVPEQSMEIPQLLTRKVDSRQLDPSQVLRLDRMIIRPEGQGLEVEN